MKYYNNFAHNTEGSVFKRAISIIAQKTNFEPRLYGKGYKCICPAHNDRSPSLSISEGEDGRVLLHCFAGCSIQDICASCDMKPRDLFPKKRSGYRG